ncbi:aspartate carbamoyltransferase [Patescibacteria group bacterium]|nr:aspartate carbamoyltransferase [Patescibacteria group bacterium]
MLEKVAPHRLRGQSIIWSQDFDCGLLKDIFDRADKLPRGRRNSALRNKRVILLFYEVSTRTRFSFEAAVDDLGGTRLDTENASILSSVAKGETLEDSIRVIASYGDAIILRHQEDTAAMRARDILQSNNIWVPVINAGCGGVGGQHPTQSLLDLYTIKKEISRTEGLTVAMVGDLKHGRTVRSLAYLLGKFPGNQIHFIAPWELMIGNDIIAYLKRHKVDVTLGTDLGKVVESVDIVYMTRVQKERFSDPAAYERLKGSYRLTVSLAERMRPEARIMHPLPKVDEIDPAVDLLPQAAYFRQADNGLQIRKALLEMILGE